MLHREEKEAKKILKTLEKCKVTNITEANIKKNSKEENKVYILPVDYRNVYLTVKKEIANNKIRKRSFI
ncbi:hypothetical protein [Velocimicrobium porci]|uniref:Uncharacterized protein n=1 Tax=Velocimicrobium porci TaxID=2606634 RepID=A0A6L5Y253_9FIRM|nr:hypothetical protein [Velocimicrobium porci]MSS64183.1 hypothetical protein [Velocimicrobium porci]